MYSKYTQLYMYYIEHIIYQIKESTRSCNKSNTYYVGNIIFNIHEMNQNINLWICGSFRDGVHANERSGQWANQRGSNIIVFFRCFFLLFDQSNIIAVWIFIRWFRFRLIFGLVDVARNKMKIPYSSIEAHTCWSIEPVGAQCLLVEVGALRWSHFVCISEHMDRLTRRIWRPLICRSL